MSGFCFQVPVHGRDTQTYTVASAPLEKQSKFPRYNMKSRGKRDTTWNIPRSITLSCYIAESRSNLGQCAPTMSGSVFMPRFKLLLLQMLAAEKCPVCFLHTSGNEGEHCPLTRFIFTYKRLYLYLMKQFPFEECVKHAETEFRFLIARILRNCSIQKTAKISESVFIRVWPMKTKT